PSMYEATVLKSLIEKTLRLRAVRGIEGMSPATYRWEGRRVNPYPSPTNPTPPTPIITSPDLPNRPNSLGSTDL
ncbi:hypothetical protein V498_09935, partial [Pseudogymnoascus sp. VKM F-4517 (FW-2822)]